MTIAEIKNDPILLSHISEDLDDYADDLEVVFEVYAFSYDPEWNLLDASLCLANSPDPYETVEVAKKLTLLDTQIDFPGTYVVLEVESVIYTEDEFINLGTIYDRNFF